MIQKKALIELIQAELGSASDDGDEKFSYEVIEENVDLAFLEIVRQSELQGASGPNSLLGAVSFPFSLTKQHANGKDFVPLNPRPIMGTSSVTAVIGNQTGENYGIRVNAAQVVIMSKLKANGIAGTEVLQNNLVFSKPIADTDVTVYYVPTFKDVDDNFEITLEGAEILIKDLVKARLAQRIQYPQDTINDGTEDTQRMTTN